MKQNIESLLGKVHCADCLEFMKSMPDKCVDLVLTDPPYGLDKKLSQGAGKHKNSKFRTLYENETWDKLLPPIYLVEIFRISKNQIIFGANYYSFPPTRGIICWDKRQFMPTFSRWEYAWTSFDMPARMYEYLNNESREHPTQKPLDLIQKLIADFSKENNLVCDPCLGSGTVALAAERLNRKWIGIEISPEYCKIAQERIDRERAQLKMF